MQRCVNVCGEWCVARSKLNLISANKLSAKQSNGETTDYSSSHECLHRTISTKWINLMRSITRTSAKISNRAEGETLTHAVFDFGARMKREEFHFSDDTSTLPLAALILAATTAGECWFGERYEAMQIQTRCTCLQCSRAKLTGFFCTSIWKHTRT